MVSVNFVLMVWLLQITERDARCQRSHVSQTNINKMDDAILANQVQFSTLKQIDARCQRSNANQTNISTVDIATIAQQARLPTPKEPDV